MMQPLLLIGGGGHCKSCIDVIEQEGCYNIIGILDKQESVGQKVLGYEIVGTDEEIEYFIAQGVYFLITIGQIHSSELRKKLFFNLKKRDALIASVVSPIAYVSKHAKISQGTIVMHHALINAGASVGENCIINTKALIEHDAVIESHCHVSTGAIINGGVKILSDSFIGSLATSKQYIQVDKKSFIKAGSVMK